MGLLGKPTILGFTPHIYDLHPGRCDAGYSGPSCESFCPNACSGVLDFDAGGMPEDEGPGVAKVVPEAVPTNLNKQNRFLCVFFHEKIDYIS